MTVYTAKSVFIDLYNNYGYDGYMQIRSIDFYKDGALIPLTAGDFTAYSTTVRPSYDYDPAYVFDTSLSKTGDSYGGTTWQSDWDCHRSQRIACVFNVEIEFDEVVVENHRGDAGVRDVNIFTLPTAISPSDIVFGQAVTGSTRIFLGPISRHTDSDVLQPESLDIGPAPIYTAKSVTLDFLNNHDNVQFSAIRAVDFYKDGVLIPLTSSDFTAYHSGVGSYYGTYGAEYVFDTTLPKTGVASFYSWQSPWYDPDEQRVACVFNNEIEFDEIRIENFWGHSGVKDTRIYALPTALDPSDAGFNQGIGGGALIFSGALNEHTAGTSTEDPNPLKLLPHRQPDESAPYTASTIAVDVATNYGFYQMGLRSIDFYRNGELIPVTPLDIIYSEATSWRDNYGAENVFITALSKVGGDYQTGLLTRERANDTRILCSFARPVEFDQIIVNNGHNGGTTDHGAKDVKIFISPTTLITGPMEREDIICGDLIPGQLLIFDGVFLEHVTADVEDPQTLSLITPPLELIAAPFGLQLQLTCQPGRIVEVVPFFVDGPWMGASVQNLEASTVVGEDWLALTDIQKESAQKLYYCTVTGSANGLPDILVPIFSLRSRRRTGNPSSLQVVIPGIDQRDDLVARTKGSIVITMAYKVGGYTVSSEEIARAHIKDIDVLKAGSGHTITLSGESDVTYTGGKVVPLSNVTYSSFVSGVRRVRMSVPDLNLTPGDTVTASGKSFIADLITTTVNVSAGGRVTSAMEVSEV